jgi:transcriptional regulator with XRE-family HTH domain
VLGHSSVTVACATIASKMLAIVSMLAHHRRMASLNVGSLGEFLREQRRTARLSLRQLSEAAGVSNPYLSQIERGLRKPSAEILQQIAKALRISAEALYIQAGILEERDADTDVPGAILHDDWITERQKQVLLEIYDSFRKENDGQRQTPEPDPADHVEPVAETPPAKPARKRTTQPAAEARS